MFYSQTSVSKRHRTLNILSHLNFDFEKIYTWLWLLFTAEQIRVIGIFRFTLNIHENLRAERQMGAIIHTPRGDLMAH